MYFSNNFTTCSHEILYIHSNPLAKDDIREKQSKANAFWQAKYRDEKMRERMHAIEEEAEESPQYRFNEHSHFDTWKHYKHDYIDSLPPQKSIEQELEGKFCREPIHILDGLV